MAIKPLFVRRSCAQLTLPAEICLGVGAFASGGSRVKGQPMTTQHHEYMKTLISGLNITRYQGLLKTALEKTERQSIQTLLAEEQVWLKQNMPKADQEEEPRPRR